MGRKREPMARIKKTDVMTASLGIALILMMVFASSCGQGAAPSDTGVYTTESYDIPWGLALSKDGTMIYAANYLRDNISVYDTSTMKVSYKISTMCKPLYMEFNADYSRLYVSHDKQSACLKSQTSFSTLNGIYISVIDVAAKKVVKEISVSGVSLAIRDMVFDSNHNVLYAVSPDSGKIAIVDAGSNSVVNTISYDSATFKPMRVRYDAASNMLYILDVAKGNIEISQPVDPANLEFNKIGYNKYKDGYCVAKLDTTPLRDGCPCDGDSKCKSGTCDITQTFPYCGSIACDPETYKGESGSEKSCKSTTTTSTDCKVVNDGPDCLGTYSGETCAISNAITLSGGACANDNACVAELGAGYECNTTSGDCEKTVYDDVICEQSLYCYIAEETATACPNGNSDCSGLDTGSALGAACGDSGTCWLIYFASGTDCNLEAPTCNQTTGRCDMPAFHNDLCDTDNGYACDITDGVCRQTVYDNDLCDAALEQTCDSSSGKCVSTVYKDSLCELDGYLCDRSDGICKIDRYPNGCSCTYDTQCTGNESGTDFCSDDGVCNTYASINVTSIDGYCDMRYNDCYTQTVAQTYDDEVSLLGATPCSNLSDILVLSDDTAYVACYGASSGSGHSSSDPLLRILLDDKAIGHDNSVLVTFDSFKLCDKPFKLEKDANEKTALVLCAGSKVVVAIDIESGAAFAAYDIPENSTDLVVSSDSFFVSGSTSDKITKYPIPFL